MGVLIGKGGVYGQVGGVTMSWPILVSVYSHVVEKEKKFTWLHAKNKITLTATNQIHFIYWSVLSVNLSIKAEDSSGWRGTFSHNATIFPRAILDDTTKKPKLQTVQASVSMLKFMAVQLQKACRVARRKNMTAPIRFAAMHLKITRHLLGRFRQSGGVWPQYTAYKYKPIKLKSNQNLFI